MTSPGVGRPAGMGSTSASPSGRRMTTDVLLNLFRPQAVQRGSPAASNGVATPFTAASGSAAVAPSSVQPALKRKISVVELDADSDPVPGPSGVKSTIELQNTPVLASPHELQSTRLSRNDSMDVDSVQSPDSPGQGRTVGGHSLRQRSIRPKPYLQQVRRGSNGKAVTKKKLKDEVFSDAIEGVGVPNLTARQAIRHTIATETAKKRARFLIAKKDYFLPVLPEQNYVQKLLDAETQEDEQLGSSSVQEGIVPYEELEEQPKG